MVARAGRSMFVKTHLACVTFAGLPTINNEVTRGAVYVVRNPLDVACSLAPHFDLTIDQAIDVMATRDYSIISPYSVAELIGSWSQNVASWTGNERPSTVVIRYEDMLAAPRQAFGAVVRAAKLPVSGDQLQRAIELSRFNTLSAQEPAVAATRPNTERRMFRAGRTGGWRDTLSRDQVNRIVNVHAEQMRPFGYLRGL
jgi:hypothetical protein